MAHDLAAEHQAMEQHRKDLAEQKRLLEEQAALIARQADLLRQQREELDRLQDQPTVAGAELRDLRGGGTAAAQGQEQSGTQPYAPSRTMVSQADAPANPQPVGKSPPKPTKVRPEVQSIPELGGVLTPKGQWILEPSLQYSNSQVNRLTFLGVEILESFLIGILEAQDADRDLLSPAITARYGLTNRLEIEGKIPYVWRDDTLRATIPNVTNGAEVTRDLEGDGLGDIELSMHYQINRGEGGWPFFVGNLRYKSSTGDGPFDVNRNANGIETELATGSGFDAIEPSVTVLFPTDPAVLFGNLGYLVALEEDVNKTFAVSGGTPQTVGKFDAGDAVRMSFGMAYAINSAASFTLGYKHDFIQRTETEINNVNLTASSLDVGALLLGFSYRVNDRSSVNMNLELGMTADAPDVSMTLRTPFAF
ncbi:MAG: transporter [Gammaproteobacteria bacterium]|nr:transporter [Gammaproteobacteria bacterium]